MADIFINFSKTPVCISSRCIGHIGEHRANDLVITPSKALTDDPRTAYYRVVFENHITAELTTVPLRIPLENNLTMKARLPFQVLAFASDDTYLNKSDICTSLYLSPSMNTDPTEIYPTEENLLDEIHQAYAMRHEHANKEEVLDKLTVSEGKLIFDGEVVGATDYRELTNKPKINNITLDGNVSLNALGIKKLYIGRSRGTVSHILVTTDTDFVLTPGAAIIFDLPIGINSNSIVNVNNTGDCNIAIPYAITMGPNRYGLFILVQQNANYIWKNVNIDPLATTTNYGTVILSDSIDGSINPNAAATPEAVRLLNAGKVDKEAGKGLSTEDFTTEEKAKLASLSNNNPFYGTCSTEATNSSKTVTVDSTFALQNGVMVIVRFTNDCYKPSTGNVTLNVNNTGARTIVCGALNANIVRIPATTTVALAYAGGYWVQLGYYKATGNDPGFVKLSDDIDSDYGILYQTAATPKAVKMVADIANAKQDPITDLANIRANAALGATATQPSDLEAEVTAREDSDTELQNQINNLKARGRFLSLWNATTGLAMSEPSVNPYEYRTGDYFIVEVVGTTNYKPSGTSYDKDTPSTAVETDVLAQGDSYFYDGTTWILQKNTQVEISFSSIAGSPFDNTALAGALNSKVDKVSGKGLSSEDYTSVEKSKLAGISANAKNVSVSASGTATDEVGYITVDGVEKKLAGGSKTTIVETIDDAPENPQIGDRITVLQDGSTDSVPMSAVIGLIDALNSKQNLLPSGANNGDILLWDSSQNKYVSKPKWQMIYQPVEYIEATGTQWINTGLKGADGVDIDFEVIQDVHTDVGSAVFNSREQHGSDFYGLENYIWGGFFIGRFSQSPEISKILESDQLLSRHQLRYGTAFENKIYIDGEYYSDHSSVMRYSSPTSNMCLFKVASADIDKAKARIYSARFYIGSTLARDLIPVRNVSDGSIGLYDKTEGKFYGNNGSGTFLKGADI